MFTRHIGIDLGTVNVLVHERGRGIVLKEPSVVAISVGDSRIMAVGEEAQAMLGRTPDTIEVSRPLRDGVIADYVVTEAMLRYFITKVCGRMPFFKPEVMISVPVGVTSVESRAVRDAAEQAGAKEAHLIPEPLAAALGAGLPVGTPTGNMVLNMGGGTSEAAVVAVNGIVVASSVRVGGNRIDEQVAAYVKRKYNLMIGDRTAEEIKIEIGSAIKPDVPEDELSMEVRGRDQVTGLPKTITMKSGEVTEAIADALQAIINVTREVLERTPPELVSDIIDRGVVMTGGSAQLRDLDVLLTEEIGVPFYVAEDPMACVALGAGRALESYALIRRTLPALSS
ncbi:rod shape-determining protein [bacterium]|nr:rod shape-determining protein [Chloroflexi bacterium CFX6]RIL12015.1 MAG: rod shape-determining protein [bacterium]